MKKFLSLVCAFLMGVSCAGISANAEFNPDSLPLDSMSFEDLNLEDLNLEDLNLEDLNLEDLNLEDLNLKDFDFKGLLSKISGKLEEYIKESGIDAEVLLKDGKISVGISCEYDYSEACDKITAFMKENGIDSSLVNFETLKKVIALLQGDATGDNDVNILDVIAVNKAIMGKETLTEEQLKAIDFNGNGKPDTGEAVDILKYIVGLIENFTA